MWWIPLILIAGIFTGRLFRTHNKLRYGADQLLMLSIYALLFFLGTGIGSEPAFTGQLRTLGIQSGAMTLFTVAGSIVAWKIIHYFFHEK